MNEPVIRQKIARLRAGRLPRVLDLFSGCGGLSLGFHAAGYEIAAAVEFDRDAAKSHGTNFHNGAAAHCLARDITVTPPATLTTALGLGKPETAFDVIIGGPPCQAFARVGRSKLREVADHPEACVLRGRARWPFDEILDTVTAWLEGSGSFVSLSGTWLEVEARTLAISVSKSLSQVPAAK